MEGLNLAQFSGWAAFVLAVLIWGSKSGVDAYLKYRAAIRGEADQDDKKASAGYIEANKIRDTERAKADQRIETCEKEIRELRNREFDCEKRYERLTVQVEYLLKELERYRASCDPDLYERILECLKVATIRLGGKLVVTVKDRQEAKHESFTPDYGELVDTFTAGRI